MNRGVARRGADGKTGKRNILSYRHGKAVTAPFVSASRFIGKTFLLRGGRLWACAAIGIGHRHWQRTEQAEWLKKNC